MERRSEFPNDEDLPQRLVLAGYVAMSCAGFALPCYGVGRRPNRWYLAICHPSGDPNGRITAFRTSELTDVTVLDDAQTREAALGHRWLDVFLWEDAAYVGTREELWDMLADRRDDIAARAPLTALDLSFGAAHEIRREMARAGAAYMTAAYGASAARAWRRQVARTRFLARLGEADLLDPLGALAVTDGPTGAVLSFATSNWADDGSERDIVLRAALATAEELDLEFEAPPRPPASRGGNDDLLVQGPGADPAYPAPHDAAGLSIMVLTWGPRAARIARAAKVPDWGPEWLETGPFAPENLLRSGPVNDTWLPWIEIRSIDDGSSVRDYGAVVLLADDSMLAERGDRLSALKYARSLTDPDGVVILAPALPEAGPSWALAAGPPDLSSGADIVLDTSLARSPAWGTGLRLSLDRRICDLVLTAAQACLPGSDIRRRIVTRRGHDLESHFASLAVWPPERFSDAYLGEAAFISESHVPRDAGVWLDEYVPLRGRSRRPPAARLRIGSVRPDFGHYAHTVLQSMEPQQKLPPRLSGDIGSVPAMIRKALAFPELAVGATVDGPQADGCVLVAETPTLEILQSARSEGWLVARVTDVTGLRHVLRPRPRRAPIPTEVRLPRLQRFNVNRRLAIRGVDTRDIVQVPAASGLHPTMESDPVLRGHLRTYLPPRGGRTHEPDLIVPVRLLQQNDSSPLVRDLLARYRTRGATGRRIADLTVLWSRPEFQRYILEDGRIPLRIAELGRHDTVPAQSYFAIDGDGGVPLLFGSCVFGVWARMTRSRGTGWTQRFAVSSTFETFPIVPPFETVVTTAGGLALRLPDGLANLGARLAVSAWDAETRGRRADVDLREEADREVLALYDLPSDASELEIAERLLELNRTLPDRHDGVYDIREPLAL